MSPCDRYATGLAFVRETELRFLISPIDQAVLTQPDDRHGQARILSRN
jgi:hypothetical protein